MAGVSGVLGIGHVFESIPPGTLGPACFAQHALSHSRVCCDARCAAGRGSSQRLECVQTVCRIRLCGIVCSSRVQGLPASRLDVQS